MKESPFEGARGDLEHLRRGEGGTKVLLVHGAWHDARCWTIACDGRPSFMDDLAASGHEVHALSLRGHGGSAGVLQRSTLADYVADVEACIGELGPDTTLVGHSMGGLVVSRILAKAGPRRRAALIAPVPANGMATTLPRLVAHHPVAALRSNLNLDLSYMVADETLVRALFLEPGTDAETSAALKASLGNESFLAYLGMVAGGVGAPARRDHDVLAIAARRDALFTPAQVRRHADVHGGTTALVDAGHDAMVGPGRTETCAVLKDWLARGRAKGRLAA